MTHTLGTYDGERAILIDDGAQTWIVQLVHGMWDVASNDPDDPLWQSDEA